MLSGNTYGSVCLGGEISSSKSILSAHDNFKIVGESAGNNILGSADLTQRNIGEI